MSEDILHQICVSSRNPDLEVNEEMYNQALLLIKDMWYHMCDSLLGNYRNRKMNDAFNRELEHEHEYDWHDLDQSVQTNVSLLNLQQEGVYDTLMKEMVAYFSWMSPVKLERHSSYHWFWPLFVQDPTLR